MTKLNLLVISTSTNNTHTFIGSLEQFPDLYNVAVLRYDQKWNEAYSQVFAATPGLREDVEQGRKALPTIPRERYVMDQDILMEAKIGKPDAVIYVSAWQGPFVPLNSTLGELAAMVPVIHLLNDGQDPPWFDQLYEFDRRDLFKLTVNIDGGHDWPGGKNWPKSIADDPNILNPKGPPLRGKCMTALTPLDLRYYKPTGLGFQERPFPIGYSGSPSSPVRAALLNRLQQVRGFNYRARDQRPNSYQEHIGFLQYTQCSLNVPFTGSGVARQVKGRLLEAGFAGCCCLEWASETMRSWFTPRYEYVEFDGIESCAEMAEWYAHHPKIAEDIGRAMRERVEREHHPRVLWDKVLREVV